MKKLWISLPESVRKLVEGNVIFFIISVVASLIFTPIASGITLLGAVIIGFYIDVCLGKREITYSFLSTIVASLILQMLYFSRMAEYLSADAVFFLFSSNIAVIGIFSVLGGLLSVIRRKHIQRKEKLQKEAKQRRENTRWIDRLLVSIILFFYITNFLLPTVIPTYGKERQTVDEFFDTYDPEVKYQPAAEAVITPPGTVQLDENIKEDVQLEYYQDMEELQGTPLSIGDYLFLTAKGLTYGVFKWKEPNRIRREYMEGVYGRTGNVVAQIVNTIGWTWNNPKQAWQNIKVFGSNSVNAIKSFGTISTMYQMDQREYYANAHSKLFGGDIKQLLNILNPFAGAKYSLDKRYPGGSKAFVKEATSAKTAEAVAGIFVSSQTIQMAKQGELRYAVSRGAGEIVGDFITLKTVGKVIKTIPVVGSAIIDFGKSLKYGSEFASGKFVTKDGIKLGSKAQHLYERAQQRGVSQQTVLKTLKEPAAISKVKIDPKTGEKSISYVSKDAYVAINPETGNIITTWKLDEKGLNRYKKAFSK